MTKTRRDFLTAAVTAAGAAVTPDAAHAQDRDDEHDHQVGPSGPALRVKALESLLVEKGLVDRAALDALIDTYEHKVGPRHGARVVAHAWADSAYKQRLLTNADAAIAELGYGGLQASTWWWSRTPPKSTTLSSARFAPVIRGRSWACRPSGTSRRHTARAQS